MDTLIDLTTRDEFRAGLIAAGVGVLVALAATASTTKRPLPVWGILTVSATWAAVYGTVGQRLGLAAGLLVLIVAGSVWERSPTVGTIVGLCGGAIVALRGGLPEILWIRGLTVALILVVGISLLRFDRILTLNRLAVPLFLITTFGVWATVPDTDEARALMGVLAVAVTIAWPWRLTSIGSNGAFALAGLVVWIAAVGGEGRHGSIIGAWASFGILFLGLSRSSKNWRPCRLIAIHAAVVFTTSRVAGFQKEALPSAVIATAALGLGLMLASAVANGPGNAISLCSTTDD